MKEVTRVINVEITLIGDYVEDNAPTKESFEGYIKDCLNADKVEIKQFKEFIMDKKKGKKGKK